MAKSPNPFPEKIQIYKQLLLKWAKVINLVAPSTLKEVDQRHFQDSLQLLPLIPDHVQTVYDLGSGAGFPAMVLAISRPDLAFHLIESDTKKCSFLSTVSRETNTPILIHNQRIESVDDISATPPDLITARALASLSELLVMTEMWWSLHPQVTLLFPKGIKADLEIEEAKKLFDFTLESFASQTEEKAKILRLTDVKRRPRSSK